MRSPLTSLIPQSKSSALQELEVQQALSNPAIEPDLPSTDRNVGQIDPEGIEGIARSLQGMSARKAYQEALSQMYSRKPKTGRLNLGILQFAAQMMAPTRGGTFGEAVSQAVPAGLEAHMQELQYNQDREDIRDSLQLRLLGEAAEQERAGENRLFQAILQKYNRNPTEIKTAEGVFLRHPDGEMERVGDLPDSQSYQVVNTADGVYRIGPDGKRERVGDLPPSMSQAAQMYERTSDQLSAKRDNEFYDKVIGAGESAKAQNRAIEILLPALEASDLQGAGAPIINNLMSWGQTFGINPAAVGLPAGAAPGEFARGITARLTLDKLGGSLGVGFSNADRDFVEFQMPRFGNTDQSNQALGQIMKRINDRELEVLRFSDSYVTETGGVAGLRQAIDRKFGGKSIFDKEGEGDFTMDYMKSLITEQGPTIKDAVALVDRQRLSKGAGVERAFRNREITQEEYNRRMDELGF